MFYPGMKFPVILILSILRKMELKVKLMFTAVLMQALMKYA